MNNQISQASALSMALGNDGQKFERNGITLEEIAADLGAVVTFSARDYSANDGELRYVDGTESGHMYGDPVRYEFPDRTAIVVAGDCWDFEGNDNYSFAG